MSEELRNENLQDEEDIFAGLDDYAANESTASEENFEDEYDAPVAELDQDNLEGFAKGFPAWALEPPAEFLAKLSKKS